MPSMSGTSSTAQDLRLQRPEVSSTELFTVMTTTEAIAEAA